MSIYGKNAYHIISSDRKKLIIQFNKTNLLLLFSLKFCDEKVWQNACYLIPECG